MTLKGTHNFRAFGYAGVSVVTVTESASSLMAPAWLPGIIQSPHNNRASVEAEIMKTLQVRWIHYLRGDSHARRCPSCHNWEVLIMAVKGQPV